MLPELLATRAPGPHIPLRRPACRVGSRYPVSARTSRCRLRLADCAVVLLDPLPEPVRAASCRAFLLVIAARGDEESEVRGPRRRPSWEPLARSWIAVICAVLRPAAWSSWGSRPPGMGCHGRHVSSFRAGSFRRVSGAHACEHGRPTLGLAPAVRLVALDNLYFYFGSTKCFTLPPGPVLPTRALRVALPPSPRAARAAGSPPRPRRSHRSLH